MVALILMLPKMREAFSSPFNNRVDMIGSNIDGVKTPRAKLTLCSNGRVGYLSLAGGKKNGEADN